MNINFINPLQNHTPGVIGEEDLKKFAVLLPLQKKHGEWHIVFEKRAADMIDQPGEISFPGGGVELTDASPRAAAIRETCEELGVKPENIQMIGPLDLFLFPFSLVIYPFVGIIDEDVDFEVNKAEVERCIWVPLKFIKDQKPMSARVNLKLIPEADYPFHLIPNGDKYPFRSGNLKHYFYQYGGEVIWGITARILLNFLQLIK